MEREPQRFIRIPFDENEAVTSEANEFLDNFDMVSVGSSDSFYSFARSYEWTDGNTTNIIADAIDQNNDTRLTALTVQRDNATGNVTQTTRTLAIKTGVFFVTSEIVAAEGESAAGHESVLSQLGSFTTRDDWDEFVHLIRLGKEQYFQPDRLKRLGHAALSRLRRRR